MPSYNDSCFQVYQAEAGRKRWQSSKLSCLRQRLFTLNISSIIAIHGFGAPSRSQDTWAKQRDTWEKHRDTIRSLYVKDRLSPASLYARIILDKGDSTTVYGSAQAALSISHRNSAGPSTWFVARQRGIKVLIGNRKEDAFGDTGAGQNVISDRRRKELGLEMRSLPTSFPMGNSKRIHSPGVVDVPIAFQDDPKNVMTIVCHVVHVFAYDLLLGNPFLNATKCLTKFIHRFVPCLFSLKSKWSLHLLGETSHRFEGQIGNITTWGLPDIGSVRNVMNAEWAFNRAKAAGFDIRTGPENCGWIVLPDGSEEATIGQARTIMTMPDGKIVPMVFELLPNCPVHVVLGQDFVFDHDIYTRYDTSILEFDDAESGDELMPMGYRRNNSGSNKKLSNKLPLRLDETDDLPRQLEWNLRYKGGRIASVEEWNLENRRRETYERRRDANWQPGNPLIQYKPRAASTQLCGPSGPRNSDASSLPPNSGTTLRDCGNSQNSSLSNGSSRQGRVDSSVLRLMLQPEPPDPNSSPPKVTRDSEPSVSCWTELCLGDSFGSDEAAQWQEERPS